MHRSRSSPGEKGQASPSVTAAPDVVFKILLLRLVRIALQGFAGEELLHLMRYFHQVPGPGHVHRSGAADRDGLQVL